MKVLVTGFDPFGGESVNPALEAVMLLPDNISGIQIIKLKLPTVFGKSTEILLETLGALRPDAVISVGQAGGQAGIAVERIAINIDDARIPDNAGIQLTDTPIVEGGPAAYFSTLPIKAIVRDLREANIPATISDSAGTFVCNHVMYAALHYAATNCPELRAGFVHIPYAPKQTLDKPKMPSMSTENVVEGLKVIIRTIARD